MESNTFENCTINGQAIGEVRGDAIDNSDRSINYTINNFEQRLNLKERYNPDKPIKYEYSAYCVGKYGNKLFNNCVSITCVNLHSYNLFMYDHIHVNLPIKWYNDSIFDNNIIKFKGIVEEYVRSDGSKDYTIKVTDILCSSNRIIGIYNNSLKLQPINFSKQFLDSARKVIEEELSKEIIFEFVIRLLTILDSSLCSQDELFYPGFVSNIILSYYFMNTNLNDLCQQKYLLRQLNKDILLDLGKIVSELIIKINEDKNSLYLWRHLFIKVSEICNVIQKIDKDLSKQNKKNRDDYKTVNDNIKLFGEKIDSNSTNKMFNKVKMRHIDFGFSYPESEEELKKYETTLWGSLCKMFYHQGYLK